MFNRSNTVPALAIALLLSASLLFLGTTYPLGKALSSLTITSANDGIVTGLLIENSQPAASSSTNETVEIKFGFGGNTDVARITVDKLKDYTSAGNEDSRIGFWVDSAGTLTEVAHIMPDGLMLLLDDAKIRFATTVGGGGSIQYKALSGSNRSAFLLAGNNVVVVNSRGVDGTVEIRANTSTGGAAGEATIAIFSPAGIDLVSGRIKYPATASATSEVNTLDDYEEGTFTPTAIFSAGSGTITYNAQLGRYTKIGNIVFFTIDLHTSDIAERTGNMTIGGLPFASDAVPSSAVSIGIADSLSITAGMNVTGNVKVSASIIILRLWDAITGTSSLQDTEWTDDGRVVLSGHYHVPS